MKSNWRSTVLIIGVWITCNGCPSNKPADTQDAARNSSDAKALSEGSLVFDEWRLVYAGSQEKCYNVKRVKNETSPGRALARFGVQVEVDKRVRERLDDVGESTDVCGLDIRLRAVGIGVEPYGLKAYWTAKLIASAQIAVTDACQACKDNYRQRITFCNVTYPPASQVQKHRQCLADAKTTRDACVAAHCGGK